MSEITVFGGALIRRGPNDWVWSDGMSAPDIRDETINSHNFRCCTFGDGSSFVEVPEPYARNKFNSELQFVLAAGRYTRKLGQPNIILVPLAEWDQRAKDHPCGCYWPKEIEHYVLDKAQDLGWGWNGQRAASFSSLS